MPFNSQVNTITGCGSIYFNARRNSDFSGSTSSIISYDLLDSSNGGGFDVRSGTFTCPKTGVYAFSFHGLKINGNDLRVKLLLNGATQTTSYASPNGVPVSMFTILRLKVGDRVAVSRDIGTLYDTSGEHFTVLSGFMLSQ